MKKLNSVVILIIMLIVGGLLASCVEPPSSRGPSSIVVNKYGNSYPQTPDLVTCVNEVAYFSTTFTPIYHKDGTLALCVTDKDGRTTIK